MSSKEEPQHEAAANFAKEALPCPFCGSPAEWTKMALADGHWYLRCYQCQYEIKADRRDKVIGFWNTRVTPQLAADNLALKARIKELEELANDRLGRILNNEP